VARLRAVLFDAAGTLIRLREVVGESYARAAREQGAEVAADRLSRAFARAHAAAPSMVFPAAAAAEVASHERAWWREVVRETFRIADPGGSLPDFEGCFDTLYAAFARPEAWIAEPSAHATLRALRAQGLATAVVSNFDGRLPRLLDGLGLTPLLDALVLPSDARAEKPDAAIFEFALARLGCAPAESVYVGDDPECDVVAARAAGLRAIDVRELATLADLPARLGLSPIATREAR
jgi:putative hydrolase of the HAD superfamily